MEYDENLAYLSELSYILNSDERAEKAREFGWILDPELSDTNASIFTKNGKAVLAFRGTIPTNSDDLEVDKDIAYGLRKHPRFQEAIDRTQKTQAKYGNTTLTGHSLGGTLALHAYETTGMPTTVFNPGSSPKGEKLKAHQQLPTIVRHQDDLISKGYAKQGHQVTRKGYKLNVMNLLGNTFGNKTTKFAAQQLQAHSVSQFYNKKNL